MGTLTPRGSVGGTITLEMGSVGGTLTPKRGSVGGTLTPGRGFVRGTFIPRRGSVGVKVRVSLRDRLGSSRDNTWDQ